MSNYIDYKNIIEWANREMLCDEIEFWITFKEVKREDLLVTFRRYNNAIGVFDADNNLLFNIMFDTSYYTNRRLAKVMNSYFDMNNVGECHVAVIYKDLTRDVECFGFECNIRSY